MSIVNFGSTSCLECGKPVDLSTGYSECMASGHMHTGFVVGLCACGKTDAHSPRSECGPVEMRTGLTKTLAEHLPAIREAVEAAKASSAITPETLRGTLGMWPRTVIAGTPATMLGEAEVMARRISDLCQRVVELEAMGGRARSDAYAYASQASGRATLIARDIQAAKREVEARDAERKSVT